MVNLEMKNKKVDSCYISATSVGCIITDLHSCLAALGWRQMADGRIGRPLEATAPATAGDGPPNQAPHDLPASPQTWTSI